MEITRGRKNSAARGAVFVELVLGIVVLLGTSYGLLILSQGVSDANFYLDTSRYAARMAASPLIPPPPPGPGLVMRVQVPTSVTQQVSVIENQARQYAAQFLQDSPAQVESEVVSIVEDFETFWIVRVDVSSTQEAIAPGFGTRLKASATSAFMLQAVEQG